jgi:hypothetical protein
VSAACILMVKAIPPAVAVATNDLRVILSDSIGS